VVDSQGKVFFSDLERIWSVDPRGRLALVRPGVGGRHIHQLVIDARDAVYGEEQSDDASRQQWPSAIWKLWPDRSVTYIVPETRAPRLGTGLWRDNQSCTYLADQSADKRPLLFRRCPRKNAELLYGCRADAAAYRQFLLSNVAGTALGADGSFYFRHGATVRKRSPGGAITLVAAGLAAENFGIAVGPDNSLYVAEHAAGRVVRVAPDGRRNTAAASTAPWAPTEVTVRAGVLYILEIGQRAPGDEPSFRVRKRLPNAAMQTLATLKPRAIR